MDYVLVDPQLGALASEVAGYLGRSNLDVQTARSGLLEAPLAVVCPAPPSAGAARETVAFWAGAFRPAPSVVLLEAGEGACSRAEALDAGAEDLLNWPDGAAELAARLGVILNRRAEDRSVHPLTGLPGAGALARDISARIGDRARLALIAVDIRHFKPFNDRYGYARGDEVIARLARMLQGMAEPGEIVYHIGGDDFFVLTVPERADALGLRIDEAFAQWSPTCLDPADADAGFIEGLDRRTGETVRFPPMSLTVVTATNEAEDICHAGQLSSVLAEMKQHVKGLAGVQYARDRRRIHDVAASLAERDRRQ